MTKKRTWILPIDERVIPDIFAFRYSKNPWVKLFLFVEMLFATIAVIGTLLLILLPVNSTYYKSVTQPSSTSNAYESESTPSGAQK